MFTQSNDQQKCKYSAYNFCSFCARQNRKKPAILVVVLHDDHHRTSFVVIAEHRRQWPVATLAAAAAAAATANERATIVVECERRLKSNFHCESPIVESDEIEPAIFSIVRASIRSLSATSRCLTIRHQRRRWRRRRRRQRRRQATGPQTIRRSPNCSRRHHRRQRRRAAAPKRRPLWRPKRWPSILRSREGREAAIVVVVAFDAENDARNRRCRRHRHDDAD